MSQQESIILEHICSGNIDKALDLLNASLAQSPQDASLLYLRGKVFQKMSNWKCALEDYKLAAAIDSNSPAIETIKYIENILGFYNKDVYGQ